MLRATRRRAENLAASVNVENQFAVGELQDSIDSFGNACACVVADNHAVHDNEEFLRHDFALGCGQVCQRVADTIGQGAGETLRQEHRRKLVEGCVLVGINPCEELQLTPLRQTRNLADDFFAALARHGLSANGAGGPCKSCE